MSLLDFRTKATGADRSFCASENSITKTRPAAEQRTLIGSARTVEGIHEVNQLAAALAEMPQKRLTEYKAILTATRCSEFDDAI